MTNKPICHNTGVSLFQRGETAMERLTHFSDVILPT